MQPSSDSGTAGFIKIGGAVGLVLLIAAVWATGAGAATKLALTAVFILAAVAAAALALGPPRDPSDDQRERMQDTTP